MARKGRFYFSRIVKGGVIDKVGVQAAILNAESVESNRFAWTIVNTQPLDTTSYNKKRHRYIGGELAKYDPDAVVPVVNEQTRKVVLQDEPNMARASSMFVYFPDHEIFLHHHVWNEIRDRDFQARMAQLIEAFFGGFFAECELHTVSDYTRFVGKLAALDTVTELSASVRPPNPLFSPFWSELKDYLSKRRLRRMKVTETAVAGNSVATDAPEIARRLTESGELPTTTAMIGDAALLMAADGYGRAEVTGQRDGREVTVSTRSNALQIKVSLDATYAELASAGIRELVRMEQQRKLRH